MIPLLIYKVIYEFPIVLVQPIAVVEFKTYPPIVVRTIRDFDAPRLLTAIAGAIGKMTFTAADLIETINGPAHRDADVLELRAAIGGMDAKGLGEALAQIQDENFGGFLVERLKRGASGRIWVVNPVA